MKKYVLLFLTIAASSTANASSATTASSVQDSIWTVPALPQRGARVTIYFKSDKQAFAHAKTLSGGFYSLTDRTRIVAQDLTYKRSGDNWVATATVPDTAYVVVANLVPPDTDAAAAAIAVGLDSAGGQPFLKSYHILAFLYYQQNPSLGIPPDKEKVRTLTDLYWKGLPAPPSNFSDKLAWYLIAKTDTAKALSLMANLPLDSKALENDYGFAAYYAGQIGNRPLSTLLVNIQHLKFLHGDWNRFDYYDRILKAKDTAEQWAIIREYKKAYPNESQDQSLLPSFNAIMQNKLMASGDLSGALALIPPDAGSHDIAGNYNNLAWGACEQNIELPRALALSKASLDTIIALEASGKDKPVDQTRAQYQKNLIADYALYADTYAYLLYKTGAYKEAFAYEKKCLADIGPRPQLDIIARYHLFMEKVEKPSKVIASLSVYIAKGQSDTTMEAQFKRLYTEAAPASGTTNTARAGQAPADAALAALKTQAKALKQAEMVKTIMNDTAANFTLSDLDGNKISLASLKGKTVVLDFWATWCGPCKASFPAMQKLVDQHKDDKNIVFLFIDTRELADDKRQNAANFIRNSPYTFHVLLDNDNKVITAYQVEGIPTKFVIDKNGITRFKAVGFFGDTDKAVDELESMIAITNNN